MEQAPPQNNLANELLLELLQYSMWPYNPTHLAILSGGRSSRRSWSLNSDR